MSTILIGCTLGTVLVAILCVGIVGVTLLKQMADEQALARVRLGGISAVHAVQRDGDRLQVSAELLGERPTLARMWAADDAAGMAGFLETFRLTSELSGCALVAGGKGLAHAGQSLSWPDIPFESEPHVGWRILRAPGITEPVMVAWSPVSFSADARAVTILLLNSEYAVKTGAKVGLAVTIRDLADDDGGVWEGHEGVPDLGLNEGRIPALRDDHRGLFWAEVPLQDRSGHTAGSIEAALPTQSVDDSLRGLKRSLLLLSSAVAVLATLLSLRLARSIAKPIETLTRAAARIGRGDLSSRVPRVTGRETSALATTLDEMRERILVLTGELQRKRAEAEAILGV